MKVTMRSLTVALTALSSVALLVVARPAEAQVYTGEAYILRGNVGVNVGPGATPLVDVAAGAEINRVNLPFPNGGPGNVANGAGNGLGVTIGTAVDLDVVSTTTAEIASAVTSDATITGANILPNFSTFLPNSVNLPGLNLNVNVLGVVNTNVSLGFGNIVGSLTTATVIRATALDTPLVPASGTSQIAGLNVLGSPVNVAVDGSGNPLPNQTFFITVPINLTAQVQTGPLTVVNLSGTSSAVIGEIIINEQLPIPASPDLITVNALHIKLYPVVDLPDVTLTGAGGLVTASVSLPTTDILGEDLATTDLILSSATAGAAAPEPGAFALFGLGLVGMAGVLRRKRAA